MTITEYPVNLIVDEVGMVMQKNVKSNLKIAAQFLSKPVCWCCLFIFPALLLTGCGGFFAHKPTEIESRNIIREQSILEPVPDTGIRVPEIYTQPPKIIEGKIGEQTDARLYYFTKYHTASKLKELINTQFLSAFLDAKNKAYPKLIYSVSANDSTNQLIIRCPSVADAEQVHVFLKIADIPPIQVKIDCLISEVYADHTMDWETTLEVQNFLGASIALEGLMPGAALRDKARQAFGLQAGYDNFGPEGHKFNALVDLLVSRGYLKILMNPQLEVLNGQTAIIETSEHVPLDIVSHVQPITGVITQSTQYHDVKDILEITPYAFGDGYIGIKTKALIGSKATPEGVAQTPIVTTREVTVEENRIRQGESLIIGGIRKTEKRSVIRGIPFLKDIPMVGILFSSKDYEERTKEVLFILTPTISTGGRPTEELRAEISRKHTNIPQDMDKMITDPFGSGTYTDLVEGKATQAEVDRLKSRMKLTEEQVKTKELQQRLKDAAEQAQADKAATEKALADAQAAKAEALTATAAAEQAQAQKAEAEAQAQKIKAEAEAATAQAQAAKAAAQKSQAEAAAAKAQAEAAAAAAKKAEAEAQKAKAEAEAQKPKDENPPSETPPTDTTFPFNDSEKSG